jgi:site-specific recombinase XerD
MSQEAISLSIPCLDAFRAWLTAHDCSAHSIRAYGADVYQFAAWFTGHTGEAFALSAVTEYDVQAWRDALAVNRQPASINRKLAALGALFRWAVETGQGAHDPTAHVSGVAQQPLAPRRFLKATSPASARRPETR